MRPSGVGVVVAAVAAALVPAADAAVSPPPCWKGRQGCVRTSIPHWNVRTYTGSVSVVGTRPNSLTCADVANGPREEIVAGRYTVKFSLDRARSRTRIGADAHKLPITSKPLALAFAVTATTHERVRMLAPAANGCTESFRDCNASKTSTAKDSLDVFARARRVVQETPGDFIRPRLLECAETPDMTSLLPADPLEGKFMTEPSTLAAFRHRGTVVNHGSERQIGDGSTSVTVKARITYARSIRTCTAYAFTPRRCTTTRG